MLLLQSTAPDYEQLVEADSVARAKIYGTFDQLTHMPVEQAVSTVTNSLVHAGLKILVAVGIFIVGRWIVRRLLKFMTRIFERRSVDPSLRTFLLSLTNITLMLILIITVVGILGINTTSFLAIFASAGLAIGVALSGTLQNFAGGVIILLIKPYRVGDYIETQDEQGSVKSITLIHTVINTPDNRTILIPNGSMTNSIIDNFSTEPTRRVEWKFSLAYGVDIDKARELFRKLLDEDKRVLPKPDYVIEINTLGDSSVEMDVQAWAKSSDYMNLFYTINRNVYKEFPANGIEFPFQQIDVNLYNKTKVTGNNGQM